MAIEIIEKNLPVLTTRHSLEAPRPWTPTNIRTNLILLKTNFLTLLLIVWSIFLNFR